jgi:hypothetical protein
VIFRYDRALAVLLLIYLYSLCLNAGNDLRECKAEWKAISSDAKKVASCMEKLLFAVAIKSKNPEGVPVIGLESTEPMTMAFVRLADSALMSGHMTNLTIYGVTDNLKKPFCAIT